MKRRIGLVLAAACLLGAWTGTASAHGGWRGGHRGGIALSLGFGLGYPGAFVSPFYGYPFGGLGYPGYPYYGPGYVLPPAAYGVPYPPPPPIYSGPPAYVGPQQPYVAPPTYSGPLAPGQPAQPAQPAQATQPGEAAGTAPYDCQSPALAEQLGAVDAGGAPAGGGRIVEALVPGEAGRQIDLRDQACMARALELAPAGRRVTWQGLASATRFSLVASAIEQRGERACRSFEAQYASRGNERKTFGTACRRPDGVWLAAG